MRISVIVPGYNTPEQWWRRCVESVLKAGADEVICVDDGSHAAPKFLEDYPVQVIYLTRNVGQAEARNRALDLVTSDFVSFVDSDDEVRPETFERCRMQLTATGADVAVYGVKVVWPEDGLMKVDLPSRLMGCRVLTPQDVRSLNDRSLLHYPCNKVYRVRFLKQHRIRFVKEGMPCEDIVFNLDTLLADAKFCMVDYAGYVYYRTRCTSLSRYKTTSDVGRQLAVEAWRKYKAHVPDGFNVLGAIGETSAVALANASWRNAWMPGTPFSLVQRWRMRPGLAFFKMALFMVFRRYFYFRFIRRWNTRRNYPHVIDWHEE